MRTSARSSGLEMREPLTFVTNSSEKVAEAQRILGTTVEQCPMNLSEIQAVRLEEVIESKAKLAFEALQGKTVIVEDTGLFIEAWNGLPGALVKWFVERVGAEGMSDMMRPFLNKNAFAQTIVAVNNGKIRTFSGRIDGQIASVPSGDKGFGWDRIFIPEGANNTFAEMTPEEKDRYSMRRAALESMAAFYSRSDIR
jgi:non-canonical purine NTP pyrophosphatase (RdgB/HAM1 family)